MKKPITSEPRPSKLISGSGDAVCGRLPPAFEAAFWSLAEGAVALDWLLMSVEVAEVLAFELLLLFTSLELAAGLVEEAGAVWSTLLVLLGMVLELEEAVGCCADVASGVVLEVEDELDAGC